MISIKSSLSKREADRVRTAYELSQSVVGYIVDQPSIDGSVRMTLSELCKHETSYNQLDIQPSKVKSILLKSDTGLCNNEFFLFTHIVLGKTNEGDVQSIVSGRHRLAALLTVCDLVGILPSDVSIDVLVVTYPSEKLLARSIAAYNTNRTMTGAERERVMLSSELNGEEPTAFNAKGVTTNKRACKNFFKQVSLTSVMDCLKESDYDELGVKTLTVNNQGRVFGYMFDILTDDNPEFLKQLKSGDSKTWSTVELLASYAFDEHYLDQPESGNISRNGDELSTLAYNICKNFFATEDTTNETTEDSAF
jgi:hypothetical protein